MKYLFILFILIFSVSCNQDQGPEQVLRSYVNMRFQTGTNFDDLLKNTTGELESNLKGMSAEDKLKFEQTSQFKKKSLKILSKDCVEKKCKITYIISYERKAEGNPYNAEIRNVAQLTLVEGTWKIESVGGLKSYFESKKDIEP